MKNKDEMDSRISAKNRLIQKSKCISCCLFVFGCASRTAVQAEPKAPSPKIIYLEDEEGAAALPPANNNNDGGPPTARFEEGIGFDNGHPGNVSHNKSAVDMTIEKLNNNE